MFTRLLLRVGSLGLKFALTIIVARMLGFGAVADYGIAVAASVIASKILGLGVSTEINRRLSLADPVPAIRDARRMLALYGAVYLVIFAAVAWVTQFDTSGVLHGVSPEVVWGVATVAISEHAALETNSWLFSLHRTRAASILLFVRTGAWAGVAVLGLIAGAIRTIETVFMLWWATNAIAIAASWFYIDRVKKRMPTGQTETSCPHPREMLTIWKDGFAFYVATAVLSSLQYVERFIASGRIGSVELGHYVFAWSVANSVQTVAFATVAVTSGPRFVRALSVGGARFRPLLLRAAWASGLLTAFASVAILTTHEFIFRLAHEPAGSRELIELAVLLLSFVLRSVADVLWGAAIALRSGRIVLIAISTVAGICVPIAWSLIAHLGAMGAALAHLTASLGIVAALLLVLSRTSRSCNPAWSREVSSHVA